MQYLDNWHLVQLTHLVAIGELADKRLVQTSPVWMIDGKNNIMVCEYGEYQLGTMDKVWANTDGVNHVFDVLKEESC